MTEKQNLSEKEKIGDIVESPKAEKKKSKNRLIKYLVYLLVVTMLMTSSTLAKYAGEAKASANATVALFAVGTSSQLQIYIDDTLQPGSVVESEFYVQNYDEGVRSETAISYEVQIETTGNLPLKFELSGSKEANDSDANSVLAGGLDEELRAVGGELPVAADESEQRRHTYTLKITWPASETSMDYSYERDLITVKVDAAQVDPTEQIE